MAFEVINETALKAKSASLGVAFPNVLYGCVLEELLRLVYSSEFSGNLWLANPEVLGVDVYRKGQKRMLKFYYMESANPIPEEKLIPGQKLSWKMASYMIALIFRKERSVYVSWKGMAQQKDYGFAWNLIGELEGMDVLIEAALIPFEEGTGIQEKGKFVSFMNPEQEITYMKYPSDNLLSDNLYEIIKGLELIDSMEAYAVADEILRTKSISGRRIVDELMRLTKEEPELLKLKRMEQLQSYRDYTYMKKRWEKYAQSMESGLPEWEEVIDRLCMFLRPVWNAVCENEIFFDDWMPELGRFLG